MTKKELKGLSVDALAARLTENQTAVTFLEANNMAGATGALKQEIDWIVEIQTGTAPKIDHEAVAKEITDNLKAALSTKPLGAKTIALFNEAVSAAMKSEAGLNVTLKLAEDGTLSFNATAKKTKASGSTAGAGSGAPKKANPYASYVYNGKAFASAALALGSVDDKGHYNGTGSDGTILGDLSDAKTPQALPTKSYSKPREAVKLVNKFKLGTLDAVIKADHVEAVKAQCEGQEPKIRYTQDDKGILTVDVLAHYPVYTA